jgi:hypothetical protein
MKNDNDEEFVTIGMILGGIGRVYDFHFPTGKIKI